MTAGELVALLRSRGVALEASGPTLVVRPASSVTPQEVAALKACKREVLALLVPPRPPSGHGYAHPWPDALPFLGPRTVGPFSPCEGPCGTWSWVRYGAAVVCLRCAQQMVEPTLSPDADQISDMFDPPESR